MTDLGNRVHIFARPHLKEEFIAFFSEVLGCRVVKSPEIPNLPENVAAFLFANGASLSVEFTEDALDEQQALRGAYLELESEHPEQLKQKVLAAGRPQVPYEGNAYFYFAAPGGQVMRIVPTRRV